MLEVQKELVDCHGMALYAKASICFITMTVKFILSKSGMGLYSV